MLNKEWILIDAKAQPLGRLASAIAKIIRGKTKPTFTPHIDCGDYVIVINAEHIQLTKNKWDDKKYISHTGYPGGQRIISAKLLKSKHPARIIERAVKGMLPKNRLGRKIFHNLHVYAHDQHPHIAQKPKAMII